MVQAIAIVLFRIGTFRVLFKHALLSARVNMSGRVQQNYNNSFHSIQSDSYNRIPNKCPIFSGFTQSSASKFNPRKKNNLNRVWWIEFVFYFIFKHGFHPNFFYCSIAFQMWCSAVVSSLSFTCFTTSVLILSCSIDSGVTFIDVNTNVAIPNCWPYQTIITCKHLLLPLNIIDLVYSHHVYWRLRCFTLHSF